MTFPSVSNRQRIGCASIPKDQISGLHVACVDLTRTVVGDEFPDLVDSELDVSRCQWQ